MQSFSVLPIALALLGIAEAQRVSFSPGGPSKIIVGDGFRCYEYSGTVKHVDAQNGVEAIFYNRPGCSGSRQVSTWGSTTLDQNFEFQSIRLTNYDAEKSYREETMYY
ncbi:hypothetical protein C2857_004187 [Epichloe festucae Fl1]|uniref:Uncharacterized protein n=1 Tax=Epichloe festucae (strain Fl1) TaxID=877507 RepID=A0A7S9KP58_EPIFF|nr:hypothetical protein C2857_004187 [Epichloe festucae Fl1]